MKYYLVRHGKTNASDYDRAKYGIEGAPLNDLGVLQAKKLNSELINKGIIPATTKIECSELLRAVQTAEVAGFSDITTNRLLNEINTGDVKETVELLAQGKVPDVARTAANAILKNPPNAKIWVTHGLVIAAIKYELGLTEGRLEPNNCEIVEINIGSVNR